MIRYTFTADPDLFTVTIETGETDPVRASKNYCCDGARVSKEFDDENHQSEFEKWLSSTTGENTMEYISEKYMINNPQSTSSLNPLPNGGYSVNMDMVNGTFTITKRDESVCLCVSICIIMRDEILPQLYSMLVNR